jgi:hypothetical protein
MLIQLSMNLHCLEQSVSPWIWMWKTYHRVTSQFLPQVHSPELDLSHPCNIWS